MNDHIRGKYPYKSLPPRKIKGVSLTKPDQSLSIQAILDRYASGRPLMGIASPPFYDGEDGFTRDPRTLDWHEIDELRKENAASLDRITKLKKEADDKKSMEAFKKALREEIKAEEEALKSKTQFSDLNQPLAPTIT